MQPIMFCSTCASHMTTTECTLLLPTIIEPPPSGPPSWLILDPQRSIQKLVTNVLGFKGYVFPADSPGLCTTIKSHLINLGIQRLPVSPCTLELALVFLSFW